MWAGGEDCGGGVEGEDSGSEGRRVKEEVGGEGDGGYWREVGG